MANLSVSDICEILAKQFDEDVVETFRSNKIDSPTFMDLTNEDLKELGITALGDRKNISKLKDKLQDMDASRQVWCLSCIKI